GTDARPVASFLPTPYGYFENTKWRLSEAVRLKTEQIGGARTDVVLLVDYDLNGLGWEDTDDLENALAGVAVPYREVWAADLGENPKFIRVWSQESGHI